MSKPCLYLLLGLPGSGKTTAAQKIAEVTGAVHLSSDGFRLSLFETPTFSQDEHDSLYKMLDYMCELLLKNGTSVVYDANLNRLIHRQQKYQMAKRLGADVKLYWLQVHRDTAKQRRLDTQDPLLIPKNESAHDLFERVADVFEPPKKTETYKALDGTKITAPYIQKHL